MQFPATVCSTSMGELDADHCVDVDESLQANCERLGAVRIAHPSDFAEGDAPASTPKRKRAARDEAASE
jgi:hypothetical protein